MMKRVLIACRAYSPDIAGGGEISTKSLAENLIKSGYYVDVVAVSDENIDEEIDGVQVHRIKYKNLYWSFKKNGIGVLKKTAWHLIDSNNIFISSSINDIIDKVSPDILITSTIEDISSSVWKIAKKRNIRVIHILRSYSLMCVNSNMFKNDNCKKICSSCKTMTLAKKYNSNYVDDVVGISDFILNKHIDSGYFKNARRHVIYNMCLDSVLENRVHHSNKGIVIGYLGRVHKTKGIETIFQAIERIADEFKNDIVLKIAGTGDSDYVEELKLKASEFNIKCEFLGLTPANILLDAIDLLVVPSRWNEPFGRVVVESLGRKVPVAGRKVGGIPELLDNNREYVFENSEELSNIIINCVSGKTKFDFELSRFTNDSIIGKWKDTLDII